MNEVKWREYVIRATSYALKPKGWRPQARVMLGEGGTRIDRDVLAPDGVAFDAKAEADKYAVEMATRWVDENYPFRP